MPKRLSPHLVPVFLGCLLLPLGCRPDGVAPTLSEFHGCDDLWYEPAAAKGDGGTYVCALAGGTTTPQHLWVKTAAPAGVALVTHGAQSGAPSDLVTQLTADGQHLDMTVSWSGLPRLLTLTERTPLGTAASGPAVHIRLVQQARLPVEQIAADAIDQKISIDAGLAALNAALPTPPYNSEVGAKARLLHARADLEAVAGQNVAAQHDFEQALQLAEPAGLTMLTANSARLLAFQHYTLRHDIPTALHILGQHDAAVRMVDIEWVLARYNRGVYAQESGHLSEALRLLGAAQEGVKELGEDDSRRNIAAMHAVALAQQGLNQQAEAELQALLTELKGLTKGANACERSRLCNTLGWIRILGQESRTAGAQDPIPVYRLAQEYRAVDHCSRDGKDIAMNLARAELLAAELVAESADAPTDTLRTHLQAAEAHLAEGTRDEPIAAVSKQLDTAELRGRIAYLKSSFTEAAAQLDRLLELAQAAAEPDYQARALLDQARVYVALARTADAATADRYTQAAHTAFASAEAQLDKRLGWVPLTTARRAFLPRFAAGTAAFVEFLIANKEPTRAFEVARRAQVRGLVTALSFDTLNLLPEAQRQRLMKERDTFVQQSALSPGDPATGQLLETLLDHLRVAGLAQLPLRPLLPGEVTHLCHPLPHDDLACFVADQHELRVERLSAQALRQAQTPAQQTQLLLAPFATLINRAQVLRVLPSARLREVNFPALPWPADGGYLATAQRLVVYALDLELPARTARPAAERGKALMLSNLNLKHAQLGAPLLFARLQQLGWQVTPYSNQPFDHGMNLRRRILCGLHLEQCPQALGLAMDTKPGSAVLLKQALPTVELAHLDTHAFFNQESGWQSELEMPDQSRLSVLDLLTLERAPRWTVLLVCDGGKAGEGAAADEISLAQALLLRGGEAVVTSTQPLDDQLGRTWSDAIYGPKGSPAGALGAAQPSLSAAFRAAQAAMRRSHGDPQWSALRLFVP